MKLQIFGDSILQGVVYSDEQRRYRLRKGSKYDSFADNEIEVENHSRMGATAEKILNLQERFINKASKTDVVLLEMGGNDCDYNWQEVSNSPESAHNPKTPPELFKKLYAKAIKKASSNGARVAVASLVPIDSEKYLSWISKGLSKDNIISWLGDVSMLSRWHEYYNHIIENIARKNGCIFVDLRGDFLLRHDYGELICTDGIHPTEKGYSVIEDKIRSVLLASV